MPSNKHNSFRQPVIAVMGHVDHGKTSLLDAIRGTRVTDKEHGGITQNTRAHEVTLENAVPDGRQGHRLTFIDTPGHQAFSKMRERGARVTDFVLLVVAADDGVQPQTKESIQFALNQKVPIIVAINKIDIEGIKTQKIKQELSSFGVVVEEYGGEALCFEVSATKKIGIKELLDGIVLLSEINELKPNKVTEGSIAEAFVLESISDKQLGKTALCVLKAGNLDERLNGVTIKNNFKVRSYLNEDLKTLSSVHESQPFIVSGLDVMIDTGEILYFVDDKDAKEFQKQLQSGVVVEESKEIVEEEPIDKDSLFAQLLVGRSEQKEGLEQKQLNIIVKASTGGTLEAVLAELAKLDTKEAKVNILYSSTGEVSEQDIFRAKSAKAIVVSFQLPPINKVAAIAKTERVLIRNYEIIYEMTDEIKGALEGLNEPLEEEVDIASATVKQVFKLTNGDIVAGCIVNKGIMLKGYRVKVEKPLGKDTVEEKGRGKITSLRMGKNEVKEVKKGSECGILIDPKVLNIEEGDEIVAFKLEKY